MEAVAEQELSVVLSSHLVSDVERSCDYLIVLVDSRVQVSGDIDTLLATHYRLVGPRRDEKTLPANQHVISASHTDRQSTLLIRTDAADPRPGLDGQPAHPRRPGSGLHGPVHHDRAERPPCPGGTAMIWLTWRQFRLQALVVVGAVAALAILLAVTGPDLLDHYNADKDDFLAPDRGRPDQPSSCTSPAWRSCTPLRR